MNILLICECDKRALPETRRILDQFAERRGNRTWQSAITEAGLDTLRRLLRKTARKNTAVACHWIRGRDHSQLLWIVGNARRFNAEGAVPTNTTTRDLLRQADENDWYYGEDIRLLAQMAALLHDLGKANTDFQERLTKNVQQKNLYRHEWISLRLFQTFLGNDNNDDTGWLQRLADPHGYDEHTWTAPPHYPRDGLETHPVRPFTQLPPLAAAIGWLVLTHHRLPVVPVYQEDGTQSWLGRRSRKWKQAWLETPLSLVTHAWNEIHQSAAPDQIVRYWTMADTLPVNQPKWRAQAARLARQLLDLRQRRNGYRWLDNPSVMHLARLSLMLADHFYSGLPKDSAQRVEGDARDPLWANTDKDGRLKQRLGEHLLGVTRHTGMIAHALPGFERDLPRLVNHRGLRKRSTDAKFAWQNIATDAAAALRAQASTQGVFIVNMASTGCGKTLANARIVNTLCNPQQGMRATYALGLRTLTRQTGSSYRTHLHLDENALAMRVGGTASDALFAFNAEQAEAQGSASIQALIEEDSHLYYAGHTTDHPLLSRALDDDNIRQLLSAPILVCTVDHLTPATESLRAGRQIAPILRLMSSDLILDELDDYSLEDLPALTWLVHWAGMLGTRVLLSSATLPPALVEGMFLAYHAGRAHYHRNRGNHSGEDTHPPAMACLWTDEFGVHSATCAGAASFAEQHAHFVQHRAGMLAQAIALRRGELLALDIPDKQHQQPHPCFATHVRDACLRLHAAHADIEPVAGKQVSFGLVRMANIDPLFEVAQALFQHGAPEDTRIHLCVYHARFPLVQRSAIEHQLDAAFNRRGHPQDVYRLPAIRRALDAYPETQHLFVVLASPICEVGRDWDADWAIAEPSSTRSLIQLAGRVQRHRGKPVQTPNVLVFDTNLKYFNNTPGPDGQRGAIFVRPGFEHINQPRDHPFRLSAQRLQTLIAPDALQVLNALPRIQAQPADTWRPKERLIDLEHARMADCMPQQQPFRDDPLPSATLVFLPDADQEHLILHRIARTRDRHHPLYAAIEQSQRHDIALELGERITPWGQHGLMDLLAEQADFLDLPLTTCCERLATLTVPDNSQGWRYHPALGFASMR